MFSLYLGGKYSEFLNKLGRSQTESIHVRIFLREHKFEILNHFDQSDINNKTLTIF